MKETDSIPRLQAEPAERELRFTQPELARVLEQTSAVEIQVPRIGLALGKLSMELAASPLITELVLASRVVAAFQESPEFRALQANATCMSEMATRVGIELTQALAPFRAAVAEIRSDFASYFDIYRQVIDTVRLVNSNWRRDFESVTAEIAKMAPINFGIPESALLHWPPKVLASRTSLLEDCVLNTAALERFCTAAILPDATVSPNQLAVAGQFVIDHAQVVRRLPPRLPEGDDWRENAKRHRDEQIGERLELALLNIDERLVELRQQAWRNLGGGVAGARLGMVGIREIFTDILHALAPDAEVKATAMWQTRSKDITRPTRRMRLAYVLGDEGASEADALLQFSESVNRTQRFVHAFADDTELVRVQMTHVETWIYLLLLHSKKRLQSS